MRRRNIILLHAILLLLALLTLAPYLFLINNSFRTNSELYRSFFGVPARVKKIVQVSAERATADRTSFELEVAADEQDTAAGGEYFVKREFTYSGAVKHLASGLVSSYRYAWKELRPYTINTIFVCLATVCGVLLLGSISAYVLSRYRFAGRQAVFITILSIVMVPGVLTLVPSFLVVKKLGLLNSYWVLVLPYIAGGQIFAIFLFKGFFDGLPEELFESARLDGAGFLAIYRHIVLPLSGQVIAVVTVMSILGTWNNFMWPFITNTDSKYHVITSGLFLMQQSQAAANYSAMLAGYLLASIPLLVLFIYATKPFMQGITSGAFKA